MIKLVLVVVLFFVCVSYVRSDSYPTCGDCWCIPANNGSAPCPKYWQPQTEFSNSSIETYRSQIPVNPYTLSCNPYKDSSCTTTPPQTYLNTDTAVCGYVYEINADGSKSCSSYSMVTYQSREELMNAGAIITHEGSCGLCSTTQDLAVYLSKRLFLCSSATCFVHV
jgi:hypothetical protein